jgi:hypothetical protein
MYVDGYLLFAIYFIAVQALDGKNAIIAGASKNFILLNGAPSDTPLTSGEDQYKRKVWMNFETIQGVSYYFGNQMACNF